MTITHRPKSSGSALSANVDNNNSQIDDKEPPKYHCDACTNDVTNTVRIRCADKNCPDFDLCVTCFCSGSEPVKHKTSHDYRVVKPHTFPIFSDDWDADEELLLIQAAEKNGIGNWQAIAEYVGTRNKAECESHYLDVYVSSDNWPMPPMDKVFDRLSESDYRERKRQRLQLSRSPRKLSGNTHYNKPVTSQPTFHELQGYMPRRYEFETEHENEAEQNVKDMVFNEDDTQEEIDLKVMVLDIYNSRLDKRQERKRLIFERGWLEFKKLQAMERRRQKEERDIYNKTRVFCRLQTAEDYDLFVQGLVKEQHVRDRMAALTEWRQAGLNTLRQGDQYERDKQNRLSHLKAVSVLSNDRINGLAHQRGGIKAQMAALAPCPGAAYYRERLRDQSPFMNGGGGNNSSNTSNNNNNNKRQLTIVSSSQYHQPLNITETDGYHLLTKEEQDMCSTLYMMPRPYLVIKDLILKVYARQGFLKRKQLKELVKIDYNKANRIFDFFVENGWIKAWQDPAEVLAAQQWELQQQQQQQQLIQLQQLHDQATQVTMATATAAPASTQSTELPSIPPPPSDLQPMDEQQGDPTTITTALLMDSDFAAMSALTGTDTSKGDDETITAANLLSQSTDLMASSPSMNLLTTSNTEEQNMINGGDTAITDSTSIPTIVPSETDSKPTTNKDNISPTTPIDTDTLTAMDESAD
ncbi:hypothetical protein BC941DRAFT_432391 [Chlamydoabsidia padenii]|nr:hypothetical protein BC941DRAFT_432391 [Chlamydoabsidia padenii]